MSSQSQSVSELMVTMPDINSPFKSSHDVVINIPRTVVAPRMVVAQPQESVEPPSSAREWSMPEIKYQPDSEDESRPFSRSQSIEIIPTRANDPSSQQFREKELGQLKPDVKRSIPHLILGTYSTHDQTGRPLQHPLARFISSLPGSDAKWSQSMHILALLKNGFNVVQRDLRIRPSYTTSAPQTGNVRACSGVSQMVSHDIHAQFRFCDRSAARISAMKVQMNGQEQRQGCSRCTSTDRKYGSPCFEECVTGGPGVLNDSCANCWFSGYKGCSLRPEEKVNIVGGPSALQSTTRNRRPPKSFSSEVFKPLSPKQSENQQRLGNIDKRTADGKWQCPDSRCGRIFTTRDDSRAHVKQYHTEYYQHNCIYPGCTKRFQHSSGVRKHLASEHPDFRKPADWAPNGEYDGSEVDESEHLTAPTLHDRLNQKASNSSVKRQWIEYTPLVNNSRVKAAASEPLAAESKRRRMNIDSVPDHVIVPQNREGADNTGRPNSQSRPIQGEEKPLTSNSGMLFAIKGLKDQLDTVDYAFATLKMQLKDFAFREGVDELDAEVGKLKSLFRDFGKKFSG